MALGAHLLPPFLRQCSVLRVFKATATWNRGKLKQTSIDWRGSNWWPSSSEGCAPTDWATSASKHSHKLLELLTQREIKEPKQCMLRVGDDLLSFVVWRMTYCTLSSKKWLRWLKTWHWCLKRLSKMYEAILRDRNSLSHRGLSESLERTEMCCVGEEVWQTKVW